MNADSIDTRFENAPRDFPPTITWVQMVAVQWRLLRSTKRKEGWVYLAIALAIFLVAAFNVKIPVLHGTDASGGGINFKLEFFSETDFGLPAGPGLVAVIVSYIVLLWTSVAGAISAWCHEGPANRSYHWSLPVSRTAHDLSRVAAGGLWLLGVIALMLGASVLGLLIGGRSATLGAVPVTGWISYVTGPVTLFLLVSLAGVRANRPVRVFFLAYLAAVGPWLLFAMLDFTPGYWLWDQVNTGTFGLQRVLVDGFFKGLGRANPVVSSTWVAATLFWVFFSGGAVVLGARYHPKR